MLRRMGLASDEVLRASLNAAEVLTGSLVLSGTAQYLGSTSPKWTGGITLTNGSAIQIWYRVTPFATTLTQVAAVVNGITSTPIPAGGQAFVEVGDLARISVIAESGTPYVGWKAVRLF